MRYIFAFVAGFVLLAVFAPKCLINSAKTVNSEGEKIKNTAHKGVRGVGKILSGI